MNSNWSWKYALLGMLTGFALLFAAPAMAQDRQYDFEDAIAEVVEIAALGTDITASIMLAPTGVPVLGSFFGYAKGGEIGPPADWNAVGTTAGTPGPVNVYNIGKVTIGGYNPTFLANGSLDISASVLTFETFDTEFAAAIITSDNSGVFNLKDILFVVQHDGTKTDPEAFGFSYAPLAGAVDFSGTIFGDVAITVIALNDGTTTTAARGVTFDIGSDKISLADAKITDLPFEIDIYGRIPAVLKQDWTFFSSLIFIAAA